MEKRSGKVITLWSINGCWQVSILANFWNYRWNGWQEGRWNWKTLVWLPNSKLNSECTEEEGASTVRFKRSERSISDSGQICWRTTILARQVLPRFHTRIPILSFCHASKFLCASSTQRFVDSSKIYRWNAFSCLRISLDFDNYDRRDENAWRIQGIEGDRHVRVHPWEICTYGVCIPWNSSAQVSANI